MLRILGGGRKQVKFLAVSLLLATSAPLALATQNLSDIAEQELVFPSSEAGSKDVVKPLATVSIQKDPTRQTSTSFWKMGVRYQTMKLSGTPRQEFIRQENLSASSPELHFYSLGLQKGFSTEFLSLDSLAVGVLLGGGQSNPDATSTSGRVVDDLRMQVLQAAGNLQARWHLWKRLQFTTNIQVGVMNFTQSSSNTAARFTSSTAFMAPSLGLGVDIGKGYFVSVQAENRVFPKRADFVSQAHQYLLSLEKDWR